MNQISFPNIAEIYNRFQTSNSTPAGTGPIGADQAASTNIILLCNPFYNNCLFTSNTLYDQSAALVVQWAISGLMTGWISYLWYNSVILDNFSLGGGFPFVHFKSGGYYIAFWTLAALNSVASNAAIFTTGLVANIFQSSATAQKAYAVACNVNAYLFVFITWWVLGITAYLALDLAKVDGVSQIAKNFYMMSFSILSTQGVSAMLLTTVRYWYWGGYYGKLLAASGPLPAQSNSNSNNPAVNSTGGKSGWSSGSSSSGSSTSVSGNGSTTGGGSTSGSSTSGDSSSGSTTSGGSSSDSTGTNTGGGSTSGGSSGINFADISEIPIAF